MVENSPRVKKVARLVVRRSRQLAAASGKRSNTTKTKETKQLWVWWKKIPRTDSAINDFEYSSVPMDGCISSSFVSRLGHENNVVAKALHTVIVKLVRAYPQQLMWTIVGITNMRNLPENVRRAQRLEKC